MEAEVSHHVARGRGVGVTVVLRPMLGNTFPTPGKMQGIWLGKLSLLGY